MQPTVRAHYFSLGLTAAALSFCAALPAFYLPFSLGSFGRSVNTVTDPRELQFALKFYF